MKGTRKYLALILEKEILSISMNKTRSSKANRLNCSTVIKSDKMKPSNSKVTSECSHYVRIFLVHLQAMSCSVFFLGVLYSIKSISQTKDSERYSGLFFFSYTERFFLIRFLNSI